MCGKIHIHWENYAKRINKMWEQTAGILNVIARDTHVPPSDSKWLTFGKLYGLFVGNTNVAGVDCETTNRLYLFQ